MSLVKLGRAWLTGRFPRVSGDEPASGENLRQVKVFSPRERG